MLPTLTDVRYGRHLVAPMRLIDLPERVFVPHFCVIESGPIGERVYRKKMIPNCVRKLYYVSSTRGVWRIAVWRCNLGETFL